MNKLILQKNTLKKEIAVIANMMLDYMNSETPEETICDPELEGRLLELDAAGKIELLRTEIKIRREKINKIDNLLKGA